MLPTVICLMGPTASGKTPLAVSLVQQFPMEIVSVDSAMVYRGMDIGTAKPDAEILKVAPHRLINLRDPAQPYSAGNFREDALAAMSDIIARGKIPLLVGGTMLYFRVLFQGLASSLPQANQAMRDELQARALRDGWGSLHAELMQIDKEAAARIHPNDAQRIQRALEVYLLTGTPISEFQLQDTNPLSGYRVIHFAIAPTDRSVLHARIEARFQQMLAAGFVDEVHELYARGDLTADLPSIRSVGYRQMWQHVAGLESLEAASEKAVIATRQLAKRQMTWLRSWPDLTWLESGEQVLAMNIIGKSL